MGFNRMDAKMAARSSMRWTKPSPVLVTLVYALLTTGLTYLIFWVVADPVEEIWEYLNMGYDLEEIIRYMMQGGVSVFASYGVVQLLLKIYETVMDFGYTSYSLRMARNEQPGYRNLFDGFAKFFRVLWTAILSTVMTILWSIIYTLPLVAVLAVLDWLTNVISASFERTIGAYWLAIVVLLTVSIAVSYRYALTSYFLLDDPACTGWEAVKRSREAMRGWKMELFALDVSFLGWELLVAFTAGILSLWVSPYMGATRANFYDAVVGGRRSSGSYAGPGYNYRPNDGPSPF